MNPWSLTFAEFFGIALTAPLYHWNGGNDFFSLLKRRTILYTCFPKIVLYAVFITNLLKGYVSGVHAANHAAWSALACVLVKAMWSVLYSVCLNVVKAAIRTANLLVACVTRERILPLKIQPVYRVGCHVHTGTDPALKDCVANLFLCWVSMSSGMWTMFLVTGSRNFIFRFMSLWIHL